MTISAGGGNDLINLNVGSARINYSSGDGNDTVVGYQSNDLINIVDGSEYDTLVSGNDVIVSLDGGSMLLKNAARQTLNIVGGNLIVDGGDDTTEDTPTLEGGDDTSESSGDAKLNKAGTTLTVKKNFKGTLRADSFGDNVTTIKATAVKSAINIVGNALDNKIKTGKYGSTITGGGGNDTVTCGKGVDVIVYSEGDGNDVIKSFKAGDKIQIADGEISDVGIKGSNVVFTIGDGSMTLKSALKKEFAIIDADGNEATYKFTKQNNDLESARISTNNQLPSYWFEEDVQNDPLESILPIENISVGLEDECEIKNILRPNKLTYSARSRHKK